MASILYKQYIQDKQIQIREGTALVSGSALAAGYSGYGRVGTEVIQIIAVCDIQSSEWLQVPASQYSIIALEEHDRAIFPWLKVEATE